MNFQFLEYRIAIISIDSSHWGKAFYTGSIGVLAGKSSELMGFVFWYVLCFVS